MKKYILISIFVLQIETTYAMEDLSFKYAGVFTKKIYDQSNLDPTSPEYKEEALKQLYIYKEASILKQLAKKLQPKMNIYEELVEKGLKDTKLNKVFGIIKGIVKFVTMPLKAIPLIGSYLDFNDAVSGIEEIVSNSKSLVNKNMDLKQLLPHLQKELIDLRLEVNAWRKGIYSENITKLEEKYIVKKKDIHPELQKSIELALLKARLQENPMFSPDLFVKDALSLPITHKNLTENEMWEDVENKFGKDPFFSKFDNNTKEQVKLILKDSYFNSQPTGDINLKHAYYFIGNPGVGKTTAARNIAKLLDLPYYEVSIGNPKQLTEEAVNGQAWFWGNPKRGWFAESFLRSERKEKRPLQNTFLILNDFDRLLLNKGNGEALRFLLDFLDSGKKTCFNNYFNAPLDMSRVTVIITGNQNIPSDGNENYEALMQRLKVINFPDLQLENFKPQLIELAEKYRKHYSAQTDQSSQEIVETFLKETKTGSMRVCESLLKEKFSSLPSKKETKLQRPLPPLPYPTSSKKIFQRPLPKFSNVHPFKKVVYLLPNKQEGVDIDVKRAPNRIGKMHEKDSGFGIGWLNKNTSSITKIQIWHDDYVNGISCWTGNTYIGEGGSKEGNMSEIILGKNEKLVGIKGKAGDVLDRITFITEKTIVSSIRDKREYGPFGGNGGDSFDITNEKGGEIIRFAGESPFYKGEKRISRLFIDFAYPCMKKNSN